MDNQDQAVETQPEAATEAAAAETTAVVAKAKRTAAVVGLVDADGVFHKAQKYPMPLKAPRFTMTINGESSECAQTTFGAILITYVTIKGCSFYVYGHFDQEKAYTFTAPEGYSWEPLKLDRKAQSVKAAAAKAAKTPKAEGATDAGTPDAGPEYDPEAPNADGSPEGSPEGETAAAAPSKKGKKAQR